MNKTTTAVQSVIKIRKVCSNCKMNAMHTNHSIDLSDGGYGTAVITKKLHCENCGQAS